MKSIYKKISILLFVLIIGITIVLISKKKNELTIFDYYKTLPKSFFFDKDLGDIKYPLYQKNKVWFTKSIADYEFLPIVDLKRDYIEINDGGTGGGNILIKLFLFHKSNGEPLIAITKGSFDGFYFDSSTQFYEMQYKKWVKAKNIFPNFSIEQYLDIKNMDLFFEKDSLVNQNLTLLIELSRYNNTAIVKPNFNKYDYLLKFKQNVYSDKPFTIEEHEQLLELVKNISVKSYQLEFNKLLGRFEIKDSTLVKDKNLNLPDEDIIFDKLSKLKVVKELALYIDSVSHKKRSLKLIFNKEVQGNLDYITVKAVEDNGGSFVTHLIFQVQKDNLEISLYNPIKDKYEKIEK